MWPHFKTKDREPGRWRKQSAFTMHRIHVEELVLHRASERLIGSEGLDGIRLRIAPGARPVEEKGPRVPLVSQ